MSITDPLSVLVLFVVGVVAHRRGAFHSPVSYIHQPGFLQRPNIRFRLFAASLPSFFSRMTHFCTACTVTVVRQLYLKANTDSILYSTNAFHAHSIQYYHNSLNFLSSYTLRRRPTSPLLCNCATSRIASVLPHWRPPGFSSLCDRSCACCRRCRRPTGR